MGLSTPTTAFDEFIQLFSLHNADILNIFMKEFGAKNLIFDKMTSMRTWTIFPV